uniref:Uncharacterized protein n=1 Tax=Podarcis muralis TaxID=64176 RepID=A0A670HUW0_PODMU
MESSPVWSGIRLQAAILCWHSACVSNSIATEQASHVTVNPCHCLFDPFTLDSEPENDGSMGNVGSRVEKRDSLPTSPGGLRGRRQPDGLLQKGTSQRGVFGYFHWGKWDTRAEKKHQSSGGGFQRDYESDQENQSPEQYFWDHQLAADFSKSSLPEHGCFSRCRIRPSAFKVVSWKSLLCMPRPSSAKGQKLSKSNRSLAQTSTSSSSQRSPLRSHLLHTISLDESTKAIQSFPTDTPPFKPAPTQLSASIGHNNHTGDSLDRASRGPRDPLAVDKTSPSCKSLSHLQSSGEPHPPNEPTNSLEDVVKELEDWQTEKAMESNLSENDDPFTQRFEDKWCLWMDELDELTQEIQLQLHKAQQEEKRLQEELLDLQQRQREELRLCISWKPRPSATLSNSPLMSHYFHRINVQL